MNVSKRRHQDGKQITARSVSKNKLAETAVAAGVVGVETELEGAEQMVEGVETLQTRRPPVGTVGKAALAAGASDLTLGQDFEPVAERMARLSGVVSPWAPVLWTWPRAPTSLAASQDIEVQSDIYVAVS